MRRLRIRLRYIHLTLIGGLLIFAYAIYIIWSILGGPYSDDPKPLQINDISPNGRYIVVSHLEIKGFQRFLRDENYLLNVESGDSWKMNDGGDWQFSPDSQQIVLVENTRHIAIADPDGSNHHRIAKCEIGCFDPRWLTDQQHVTYKDHVCCDLYLTKSVSVDGGNIQTIDSDTLPHTNPADVADFYEIEPILTSNGYTKGFKILDPNSGDLIRTVTYRSIYRFEFVFGLQLTATQALLVALAVIATETFIIWKYVAWFLRQPVQNEITHPYGKKPQPVVFAHSTTHLDSDQH